MKKIPHEQLALKAVLLLRTVNKRETKEEQLEMMTTYCTTEELIDYIEHFNDPQPDTFYEEPGYLMDENEYYTPSCTNHDYGPSNPWDAPGMSIHDFI